MRNDADLEARKNRVLQPDEFANGKAAAGPRERGLVICLDEFGPLNLQLHTGR